MDFLPLPRKSLLELFLTSFHLSVLRRRPIQPQYFIWFLQTYRCFARLFSIFSRLLSGTFPSQRMKIGLSIIGTGMFQLHAIPMSSSPHHMFIGRGCKSGFSSILTATVPPLQQNASLNMADYLQTCHCRTKPRYRPNALETSSHDWW